MSEMVERVAQAIAAQRPNAHLTKWEDCDEDFKWARRREAKAAIEALREPTEGMFIAGVACMATFADNPDDEMSFPIMWDQVINEALR